MCASAVVKETCTSYSYIFSFQNTNISHWIVNICFWNYTMCVCVITQFCLSKQLLSLASQHTQEDNTNHCNRTPDPKEEPSTQSINTHTHKQLICTYVAKSIYYMYRRVATWSMEQVILSPAWSNFEIGLRVNTQYVQYLRIYHAHGIRVSIWERVCIGICIILPI